MYDHYIQGGGHAELVDVGVVLSNSHNFLAYPEALPLWMPYLDKFLAGIGMPNTQVTPDYLPTTFPPATQFAAATDVAAVPYLTDKGRDLYRRFLDKPFPRAFIINAAGLVVSDNGGFDPLGRGLRTCKAQSYPCGVYAVDDRVVWKPLPIPPPLERAFSIAAKAGQIATVDFAFRLNPDYSAGSLAKFRVMQPPKHGVVEVGQKDGFPRFPAGSPFAICNKAPVRGVAVTYVSETGFSGEDFFVFAEDGPGGSETVYKMSLTIK